jgi:hypothetical protein
MTPSDPADGQPEASHRAVSCHGINGILGTRGVETTRSARERREQELIAANAGQGQSSRQTHARLVLSKRASAWDNSVCKAGYGADTSSRLGMITTSRPT